MRRFSAHATRHVSRSRLYLRCYSAQHVLSDDTQRPVIHPNNGHELSATPPDATEGSNTLENGTDLDDAATSPTAKAPPLPDPQPSKEPLTPHELTRLLSHCAHPTNGSTALISTLFSIHPAPTTATYHAALRALAVHPSPFLLSSVLSKMRQDWISLTPSAHHDIAVSLVRNAQLEEALEYVAALEKEGDVKVQGWLYDMLLYALIQREELDEALRLVQHRVRTGAGGDMDRNSWAALFDAACERLHYWSIKLVWTRQVHANAEAVKPSAGHCLAVMRAASREGDVELAEAALQLLNGRGVVLGVAHYELLMDACLAGVGKLGRPEARSTEAKEASRLLEKATRVLGAMATAGVAVTRSSTRTLLQSLVEYAPRIGMYTGTLQGMHRNGVPVPIAAVDTLLEAYVHFATLSAPVDAKTAREWLDRAVAQYKSIAMMCKEEPGIHTFNILLGGCASVGEKGTAMFLANEMVGRKMSPNAVTYDRLVSVCLRGASEGAADARKGTQGEDEDRYDYEDAFRYLSEMESKSWVPRADTLREMVEACTRAGDERVWTLLQKMKGAGYEIEEVRRWVEERWEY